MLAQRNPADTGDAPQSLDAGLKVFKLVKSNFPRIEFAPDPDKTDADNLAALKAYIQAKEASLFNTLPREQIQDEVLLKSGFPLDYQFEHITEVTGNEVWRARDGQAEPREAVVCFDTQLAAETVDWLNHRPRKCLGYRTPHEVFYRLKMTPLKLPTDALCS